MLDLEITCLGVRVDRRAAGPTLLFTLQLDTPDDEPVHAILLRTRVRIEARKRPYEPAEEQRLVEVFGERERWRDSLGSLNWADVSLAVCAFRGRTTLELPVPCTYDMEVASSKYLEAVDGAPVPLSFQFSGTAFVPGPAGFAVVHLSHDLEATWPMPAGTWSELIEANFPGHRWVRLAPDRVAALGRHRARRALPSWDAVVDDLLAASDAEAFEEVGR